MVYGKMTTYALEQYLLSCYCITQYYTHTVCQSLPEMANLVFYEQETREVEQRTHCCLCQ